MSNLTFLGENNRPGDQVVESDIITDQVNKILANKPVLLNTPGVKLVTSAYYDITSAMVDSVEVTYWSGRYFQSLSTARFGSGAKVTIPNQSLMSVTMLHLVLPPIAPADNVALCKGWGQLAPV